MQEVVAWNGEQSHRDSTFSRSPNDWKRSIFILFALLENVHSQSEGSDQIVRPHKSNGCFSIKSFHNTLCEGVIPLTFLPGPYENLALFFFKGSCKGQDSHGQLFLKEENFHSSGKESFEPSGGRISGSPPYYRRSFSLLRQLSLPLMRVSWVQTSNVEDVLVP